MSDVIIGIDLGTTNSEVAVIAGDRIEVLEIEAGSRLLPSVVGLGDASELLVGQPARNQAVLYPERSIKRRMGSDETVVLGDQSYRPQEISALILRRLKTVAENHLGKAATAAVITVPAYFSDAQRQATREAGEIAGLKVARILNEPTAAALAYEADADRSHKLIMVYDLGGGTFDVSIVAMEADVVEVRSSHGNNHLGGDDFDAKIVEHLLSHLQEAHDVDASQSTAAPAAPPERRSLPSAWRQSLESRRAAGSIRICVSPRGPPARPRSSPAPRHVRYWSTSHRILSATARSA